MFSEDHGIAEQMALIGVDTGVVFSEFRTYRYALRRIWEPSLSKVAFLMFNPSTADESRDDPTLRKCRGFAERWSYGGMVIVNLFAIRGSDPRIVMRHADPVGPDNDDKIIEAISGCVRLMCAWGCGGHMRGRLKSRPQECLGRIKKARPDLWIDCLGYSKDGSPRHPLMLPYSTRLEQFK